MFRFLFGNSDEYFLDLDFRYLDINGNIRVFDVYIGVFFFWYFFSNFV